MSQPEAIIQTIYSAISNLNAERGMDEQVPLCAETLLFGEGSALDSLSLVSVIVDVETLIADRFGVPVSLTDDRAMAQVPAPFTSVQSLASYIEQSLTE